jgi:hypothetical protein
MTEGTLNSLNNLKGEFNRTQCSDEEFLKLRDKHLSVAKIKWIKNIYNCNTSSTENDERTRYLNI